MYRKGDFFKSFFFLKYPCFFLIYILFGFCGVGQTVSNMAENREISEDGLKTLVLHYYRAFRSPSLQTACHYYVPTTGVLSYMVLSANVMNPSWISSAAYKQSTTDFLLVGAVVGTGTYIYNRQVLAQAPTLHRVLYSGVGSVLFSLGSVLAWSITRTYVPHSSTLCTTAGLALGVFFLGACSHFFNFVDAKTSTSASAQDHVE